MPKYPVVMIFTTRFAISIIIGAIMIGLSGRYSPLMPGGIAVISLAIISALADWLQLVRGVDIEVKRICDDKLSLGVENPIHLLVRNSGHEAVSAAIRDEYPEGFTAQGNVVSVKVSPRSELELLYHVTPPKRGDFVFGDIYLRLNGPLGFVIRQIKQPSRKHIKVYPNLLDMRRYEITLKRERATQPGQRVVRMRGRGTDFESLREYLPDDEYRAIDWKASARRSKLITRLYQEEKSQNVVIVLDCGRVMGPIIDGLSRLDHSINAGMMLAHVAALKGDKVGLLAFGEEIISYSPPKAGKSQTLSLLRLTYNLEEASGDSNYYQAIPYLAKRWPRRSLVVFFTDLVDAESSKPLISRIVSLSKKHLCMCVIMSDPAIIQAAHAQPEEPTDAFKTAAALQSLHDRKLAAALLARAGAIVLDIPPDKFTPSVVNQYLDIKARAML